MVHLAHLVMLALLIHPAQAQQSERAVQDSIPFFPKVNGNALTKRKFALPADFAGEFNIVVIAFKRGQQADVDSWMPHLRPLADSQPRLRVYELPVLPRTLTLMRGMIDGGMRGGIPDTNVRAATITLYINKTPFKRSLAIGSEDQITLLVVDRAGKLYWRGAGVYSEEQFHVLRERLMAIMTPAP